MFSDTIGYVSTGLKTLGVLQMLRENPEVCRPLFETMAEIDADTMEDLLVPSYSDRGTNRRLKEEQVMVSWSVFLHDTQGTWTF